MQQSFKSLIGFKTQVFTIKEIAKREFVFDPSGSPQATVGALYGYKATRFLIRERFWSLAVFELAFV